VVYQDFHLLPGEDLKGILPQPFSGNFDFSLLAKLAKLAKMRKVPPLALFKCDVESRSVNTSTTGGKPTLLATVFRNLIVHAKKTNSLNS
jgi:hypothetical protein